MQLALSLLLTIMVPAVLIYMLMVLEPFGVVRRWLVVLSFGWGIAAFALADVVESYELDILQSYLVSVELVSAPLLEEFLKMSFLILIYHFTLARYSGDGIVYGYAVGSGFAVMENAAYILAQPDHALVESLSRLVSAGLFHASLIAIVGAVVCGVIYYRRWFTYPLFLLTYLFAVFAHHMFNLTALIDYYVHDVTTAVMMGVFLLVVVIGLQNFIRIHEKRRVTHDVHDLDAQELMLLRRGPTSMDDLEKQSNRLGMAQVKLLQSYLLNEAQMAL